MINALKNISIKKGYRYLLLKFLAFLILVLAFDFITGSFLSYLYFRQTSGWEYRTKYSVEDTKEDMLIFGASRAQQQYNPAYFEERLNHTCYNVGRDGEPIFYSYAILQGVLSRYTPKVVILDVENGIFKSYQTSNDRLNVLLPFYKGHPEMRPALNLKSRYEKFKLVSHIYPYNSLLFKIVLGNTKFSKKGSDDIKGYIPLTRSLNEPLRNVVLSEKYDIDSNKVNCYKWFINDCKKLNIKLFIVCAPYYINAIGSDTSMVLVKEIAKKENIDFVDMSKDETFLNNSKLFDDTIHVNIAGSKIFSTRLADTIKLKQSGNK